MKLRYKYKIGKLENNTIRCDFCPEFLDVFRMVQRTQTLKTLEVPEECEISESTKIFLDRNNVKLEFVSSDEMKEGKETREFFQKTYGVDNSWDVR